MEALLHAIRGIVARRLCEMWMLSWCTATHDPHDEAAKIARCMKSGVKCSWHADLTHVFITPQVFPLACTTEPCYAPKRSRTPAEKWVK